MSCLAEPVATGGAAGTGRRGRRASALAGAAALAVAVALALPAGALAQLSFSAPTDISTGSSWRSSPTDIAVGDFDSDTDPDLAVVNGGDASVSVLLGKGDGTFGAPTNLAVGVGPRSVAVGDFDGDSDLDLAVANFSGNSVSVLLGEDDGTFTKATDVPVGGMSNPGATSVAVGDFNDDSDPDVAVTRGTMGSAGGTVQVLLGGDGGSFSAPKEFGVGAYPVSVAVGHFNGDSEPDLAVANNGGDNVSVLLGQEEAEGVPVSFGTASNLATGDLPWSVAVGDFDRDSNDDLVVPNNGSSSVSVLLGGGQGNFAAANDFSPGGRPAKVAVGDFNDDSEPDLAVTRGSGGASVLLGREEAAGVPVSFAAATNFLAGDSDSSWGVAVGDWDGDADPDLAVTRPSYGYISVLLNTTNRAPAAAGEAYTTDEDTQLNVDAPGVLENDSDPDGDTQTASVVSGPGHGSLVLNDNGSFEYRPDSNYNGPDSFSYRASDGRRLSAPATVTIDVTAVEDAPVANADTYEVNEDASLDIDPAGVLSNDSDPEGDNLTAVLMAGPGHGELTFSDDGSFHYTPNRDYNGSDSFTYKANAGGLDSEVVTASIDVRALNDRPEARNDSYEADEDTLMYIPPAGVLENDSDLDGDSLTAQVVAGPEHGTLLKFGSDGSFQYVPDRDYNGNDSFTYAASDGPLVTDEATVTIGVAPVDDPPAGDPRAGVPPADVGPAPTESHDAAITQLRLRPRCARPSRSGKVRVAMALRMTKPAPLQVRIDRVTGTKAARGCRIAKARRGLRKVGTLSQLPTRPTAAGRKLALTLRLKPGQYRITVRAHLDHNRVSPPVHRYLRVLG